MARSVQVMDFVGAAKRRRHRAPVPMAGLEKIAAALKAWTHARMTSQGKFALEEVHICA